MTAATKKRPVDPRRRQLLAKIHIAKAQLGLDETAYRAILLRHGAESAARLPTGKLVDVVEELKAKGWKDNPRRPKRAGRRRPAQGERAAKMRALWISLYHLGVVRSPEEASLAAWVKRMTRVDDPGWLSPEQAQGVIEGLKEWGVREAGVDWRPYKVLRPTGEVENVERPALRVLEARWRRLHALGAVEIPAPDALERYAERLFDLPGRRALIHLSDDQVHQLMERLGRWLRQALAQAKARETADAQ